ncbi:hypothetical protein K440DRAFT_643735 [Wilcoxina mikolae CBS 423.85]|nr:hypothetical protein K440DRAFT_643735 [Wilcoxina mikolae CBS 423.85]
MTELSEVLDRLGLLQYLGRLNDEGFDKWETVLDITEQDLATLNFKLGHRRILQREIASARGIAATQALTSAQFSTVEDFDPEEKPSPSKPSKSELGKGQTAAASTGKRKYRRHPKTDENAPEKPPSAYVMFANSVRDELKGQNLSFTDIAKLVGERWKVLAPDKKEMYEYEASAAKDKFNTEFEEYKKTDKYREYAKYLAEFKSKLSKDGKESTEQSELNMKRPRLENAPNSGSSGIGNNMGNSGPPLMSIGKAVGAITGPLSAYSSAPQEKTSPPSTHAPRAFPSMATGTPLSPSKSTTVAIDFSGYRDGTARTIQHQPHEAQTAPAADADSHFFPRIHPTASPHIQQQSSYLRHQPPPVASQNIGSRNSIVLPSPALRRRPDEAFSPLSVSGSISSSGSSTAPSITPSSITSIDDSTRSHRALPLPSPSSASGYFDQRTQHQRQPSQPQSPRSSYGQTPLPLPTPLPTMDHHSRTYSPSTPQHPTASPGVAIPSGGLPPPPTPRPPSQHRPE